jgi:hypothetical protein
VSGAGVVLGLDPRGDGFLAVKAGPALRYKRIDKLYNGEEAYLLRAILSPLPTLSRSFSPGLSR